MSLKLSRINNDLISSSNRKFESMGEGLLLVRIDFSKKDYSPYHWFLENNEKPPFDVAINPNDGSICYMKFFFQDEKLSVKDKTFKCKNISDGIPIFDITFYNEKNYQVFENGDIISELIDNDLFLLIKNKEINFCLNVDFKTSLFFDQEKCFSGLQIKSLNEVEINNLKLSEIL